MRTGTKASSYSLVALRKISNPSACDVFTSVATHKWKMNLASKRGES